MTPKPQTPKPEALPEVYPDVEPGDHVYFRHPERGPMSAKVLATGKHGLTATCPMGDLYRVHWERVLGVKERMNRKFKLVENGAEGCILEDDQGQRRYVAHAEDEGDEDGKPLHKSQPTPAQIEAGNYKKRHVRFQGLEISIENPAGSVRKGVDRDGHEWRTKMVHAYGYIRGSKGVDKDHVDCYLGPNPDAGRAYIVHQRKAGQWDRFDEDKVMLGFDTEAQAKAAYLKHYDDPRFLGPVTAMPMDEFKGKVLATAERPAMIKAFPDHARALFLKTHVKAHTRRLPSGKVATVGAYTDRRRERDERTGDLFAEADKAPDKAPEPAKPKMSWEMTLDEYRPTGRKDMLPHTNGDEWERAIIKRGHLSHIRFAAMQGETIPPEVWASHGMTAADIDKLLEPTSLDELPIKAVIERGRSIAEELVPGFGRDMSAHSQQADPERRLTEINREIENLTQMLAPENWEKDSYKKAWKVMLGRINELQGERERIKDEQKSLTPPAKDPAALAKKMLDAMRKRVKASMKKEGTTPEKELKQKGISVGQPKGFDKYPPDTVATLDAAKKKAIADTLADFTSLFGIDQCVIGSVVELKTHGRLKSEGRGFYDRHADGGALINIGHDRPDYRPVLFHELGHSMKSFESDQACRKFVIGRRKSDVPEKLKGESYDEWEQAFTDHFVHPYVGKDWGLQGDTEVLSMGVERFANAETLARFATQDLEHFYLVLACSPRLRGFSDIRDERRGTKAELLKG